jgi:hypothetical protein
MKLVQAFAYDLFPTLVASLVGAGWTLSRPGLSDPAQNNPLKSSAALWEGKIQLHPDTKPDDPTYQQWDLKQRGEHRFERDLRFSHISRVLDHLFHRDATRTCLPTHGTFILSTVC